MKSTTSFCLRVNAISASIGEQKEKSKRLVVLAKGGEVTDQRAPIPPTTLFTLKEYGLPAGSPSYSIHFTIAKLSP
jgi:hypothetical protein